MAQQFDDLLSNRFREVFEQYNEPYEAANWLIMKEKLAESKQKKAFLWLPYLKVASVVLLVAFTAFVTYKLTVYSQKENIQTVNNQTKNNKKQESTDSIKQNFAPKESIDISENKSSENKLLANKQKILITTTKQEFFVEKMVENEYLFEKINKQICFNITLSIDTFSCKLPQKKVNLNLFFADNSDILIENPKKRRRFEVGAKISSFYNFSDSQSSEDANLGLGFVSEYKLNDNIALNSGMFFAKNTLQNDGALNNLLPNKASDAVFDQAMGAMSQVVETNYQFYSLDIPLNVYFYHKKAFVSGGVSSFVYINEKIENTVYFSSVESVLNPETNGYEMQNVMNTSSNTQTRESFKVFDFAKMINLSFGYKFGRKKNNLMIEPYAKIPVGKLTSSQISFGMAGISVRYNF